MSSPKRTFGLTAQLVIPMLALVMVMGIFIFSWSFYLSKKSLENELAMDIEKTETIIDLALRNTLEDIKDDLIEMTVTAEFRAAMEEGDREVIDRTLYDFMSSRQGYLLDVLTVYQDGHSWIEAGIIELPIIQLRNKFKSTMSSTPAWGYLSFRALNDIRTMMICAVPIYDEGTGEVEGVLYGGIDLNSNVSFVDRLKKVSSAINAALLSRNRLVTSTSNPSGIDMRNLIEWAMATGAGKFRILDDLILTTVELLPDKSDSPLLFAFSRKNPAFKSLKTKYMQNLGILLTLATMLAVFTAWALQKRILASLRKLTDYADSVTSGEREHGFEQGRVKEFNQLGETLETMVARLDEKSTYIYRLFSSAKAPIINCDLDGKISGMNPAAQKLAGFIDGQQLDCSLFDVFPVQYRDKLQHNLHLAARGNTTPVIEIPAVSEDGSKSFFVWTFSPVQMEKSEDISLILLQGQDVTESRLATQKARESEARLRQIIDLLPQEIFANDIEGKFLLVNASKAERLGLSVDEITGMGLSDIIKDPVHVTRMLEDDRMVLKRNEKLLTEESFLDEARNTRWVETTRVPYISTESNTPSILTISMDITRIKEVEQELQSLNKELVERVSMRTTELENANSALLKSMDELRQTQDKLVETEKMASLGELVAGVAHEINTPLGIGVTSASFLCEMVANLRESFEAGTMKRSDLEKCLSTGAEAINNITKNLERSARLVSSFKQLAVDQTSDDVRQVNLFEYIQGIMLSLNSRVRESNHELLLECPPGLEVRISPGSLMQVLTQLVSNSLVHAFPDRTGGLMVITVSRSGNGVLLTYADDGIGMGAEQHMKVFEPFYTTARSSGSAGLGMHLVYNLVTRALKGRIKCVTSPGDGTFYEIWFPVDVGSGEG